MGTPTERIVVAYDGSSIEPYEAARSLRKYLSAAGVKALTRFTDTLAALVGPRAQDAPQHPHALAPRGPGYFLCRLPNARTEGFNGKAKLVTRHQCPHRRLQESPARWGSAARSQLIPTVIPGAARQPPRQAFR